MCIFIFIADSCFCTAETIQKMYTKCQTYVNKSIPDRRTKQSKEMNFNHTLHSEGVHKNKQMTKNERKFDGEKKNC